MSTCTAVGFLYQFGLTGTYLNNSSLAIISYLMIQYNWSDQRIRVLERCVHGGIFVLALGIAMVCIPLQLYNPAFSTCHIEAYPPGCEQSWTIQNTNETKTTCERGDNAFLYSLGFNIIPLWSCMILAVSVMVLLYRYVKRMESTVRKYECHGSNGSALSGDIVEANQGRPPSVDRSQPEDDSSPGSKSSDIHGRDHDDAASNRRRPSDAFFSSIFVLMNEWMFHKHRNVEQHTTSRAANVGYQVILYSSAFVLTYLPVSVAAILWMGASVYSRPLHFLVNIFLPLQGLLNFVVFARQRPEMKGFLGNTLRQFLFGWCCCTDKHGHNGILHDFCFGFFRGSQTILNGPRVSSSPIPNTEEDGQRVAPMTLSSMNRSRGGLGSEHYEDINDKSNFSSKNDFSHANHRIEYGEFNLDRDVVMDIGEFSFGSDIESCLDSDISQEPRPSISEGGLPNHPNRQRNDADTIDSANPKDRCIEIDSPLRKISGHLEGDNVIPLKQ
jgi:hypothetical protein